MPDSNEEGAKVAGSIAALSEDSAAFLSKMASDWCNLGRIFLQEGTKMAQALAGQEVEKTPPRE